MANDILTASGAVIAQTLTAAPALAFDWRAVVSVALVVALGMLIILWKRKGNNENAHSWIYYIGAVLGLCGGAMGIYYGLYKGDGIISAIVGASFVVMALYRAVGMDTAVHHAKSGQYGAAGIGAVLLLLCWLIVYAGGSFEGQADGAAKSEVAALSSPQVQAIDAQITTATAQLATLGGFANGTQAAQQLTTSPQNYRRHRRGLMRVIP